MHVCAVIYWALAGTQSSLRIGAYRLSAVAMDLTPAQFYTPQVEERAEQAPTIRKRGIPKFSDPWELLLHRKMLFHVSRMVERIWRGIQLKGVSSIITDSPVTTK